MALLVPAGLFAKSLFNVSKVDLGLKVDNVVTFGISPELNGYTNARSAALVLMPSGVIRSIGVSLMSTNSTLSRL